MNKAKVPVLIALATVLAASACLVTLPAPASVPATPIPNLALTGKVQTLTAAPTATFSSTPVPATYTSTITLTPFPSITPLPTSTFTATVTPIGFFASRTPTSTLSPTPIESPDPAEGQTTDWGSDYRCSLIDKSPSNWTVMPPGGHFRASWTLLNSGHKTWQANQMTLTFIEGTQMNGPNKVFRLVKDVRPGQTTTVYAFIYPPKVPGNYRAVWGLYWTRNNSLFCTFTVKVTVK
jgi:hypothetical protein